MSGVSKLVVAGGGVAALEAVLAVKALAADRVQATLIAPDPVFRHRPLSVTEPFSLSVPRGLALEHFAEEHGGEYTQDALASVDSEHKLIRTRAGQEIAFDHLLIATGAQAGVTLPGALAFWDVADRGAFREVLAEAERGQIAKIAFAVPSGLGWPLGLYELALLTAAHLEEHDADAELLLVTPESRPMEVFGRDPSSAVSDLLRQAKVKVRLGHAPVSFEAGQLSLANGDSLACDRVVSLPVPRVEPIEGLPQDHRGFVSVDRYGEVLGVPDVYAAGDVTTFPVKQGGVATQAADSVASVIAAKVGAGATPQEFRPVLRGAILTRWGPRYMRSSFPEGTGRAAKSVLWWPPAKIAGRYLAPYLAARAGYLDQGTELVDLDAPMGEKASDSSPEHDDLVASAFRAARSSAEQGRYERALHWLEVAEDLALYLPPEFEEKRAGWQEHAQTMDSGSIG